jgi:hypothetical protein
MQCGVWYLSVVWTLDWYMLQTRIKTNDGCNITVIMFSIWKDLPSKPYNCILHLHKYMYICTYIHTHILTYSMEHSPSREGNHFSDSQEILWNPKVHYRIHKCTHVCMYVCMYVSMYVCMYVRIPLIILLKCLPAQMQLLAHSAQESVATGVCDHCVYLDRICWR